MENWNRQHSFSLVLFFSDLRLGIFFEIVCLTDDPHEMSSHIFLDNTKVKVSSIAVVISYLSVKVPQPLRFILSDIIKAKCSITILFEITSHSFRN